MAEADVQCAENNHVDALNLYGEAIQLYPHKFGVEYANMNIKLIECHLALGDYEAAEEKLAEDEPIDEKTRLLEECRSIRRTDTILTDMYTSINFETARNLVNMLHEVLFKVPQSTKYKLWLAECYGILQRFDEVSS